METWRLLVGLTAMLLLFVVLSVLFGTEITPVSLVLAVVFGAFGLYFGTVLSNRLSADDE